MDVTSSTAGAAMAIRQGMGQFDFGVKALAENAKAQQDILSTLTTGTTTASSGNVTPTRGQNLNIVV